MEKSSMALSKSLYTMLAKPYRLTKRGSFHYVYKNGARKSDRLISLTFVRAKGKVRAGFSVSNKLGKAVVRNKLKRRMRAAMRAMLPDVSGAQMVFTARPGAEQMTYREVYAAMERLLSKCGLYEKANA